MGHDCPNCREFLTGTSCVTCGWARFNPEDSGGFAFDGGQFLDDILEGHLEAALETANSPEARYHIRSALQHYVLREGNVGWKGTYGPDNGGFVD